MATSKPSDRYISRGPTLDELKKALFDRPKGIASPVFFLLENIEPSGSSRGGSVTVTGIQATGKTGKAWNIEGIMVPVEKAPEGGPPWKGRRVFIRYSPNEPFEDTAYLGRLKFLT